MNVDVTMPQLGETVSEGTVTRWLRSVGERITDREPLLEVTTDKVDTEVPAPASGRLLQILVAEDETVSVGTVLAVIAPAEMPAPAPEPAPRNGHRPRHRHSPRVRRLAAETGVALESLTGTGPGGRVTPADVAAAGAVSETPPVPRQEPVAAPVITGTPAPGQRTSVIEVDVTGLVDRDVPLLAFVAKAVLEASAAVPSLDLRRRLSIAVETPHGVIAPVVENAGDLNLAGLARRIKDAIMRAHAGSVAADELSPATFTLTCSGNHGALFGIAPLTLGQTGALDLGAVVERPVVVRTRHGERVIAIRSMAHLALTRIQDVEPVDAARLLASVRARLETAQPG